MATEHSLLRGTSMSVDEAMRLISKFNCRDLNYKFTRDDLHTLKGIASMTAQAAKEASECYGYVHALLTSERTT